MKVTGVETFPIAVPRSQPAGPTWMIVRLDTDAGISGYGEMMMLSMGFRWPVMPTMIEDLVDSAVIGHDPYKTEQPFDKGLRPRRLQPRARADPPGDPQRA